MQLLEFDHKKRISAAQALNHPFFTPIPSEMHKLEGSNESVFDSGSKYGYQ